MSEQPTRITTLLPDIEGKPRRSVAPRSIRGRVVAGVLLLVPVIVTALLIRYIYRAALLVGVGLLNLVTKGLNWAFDLQLRDSGFNVIAATWYESLLAVVLTFVMLYLLGWLGTNAVGRRIIDLIEALLQRIPFVDMVYGAMKRMVQALSGPSKDGEEGQKVVLIDFPTENMKALGFMTNIISDRATGQRYGTVFVPTTPNPTSGYMELVPIERVTYTDLTMDAALTMVLSGGASAPVDIALARHGDRGAKPVPPRVAAKS